MIGLPLRRQLQGFSERIKRRYLSRAVVLLIPISSFSQWLGWLRGRDASNSDSSVKTGITINSINIANVRLVKGGNRGSALNKTGRLVLRGDHNGRAVKVYEAAGVEHGLFIKAVTHHPAVTECFPPIVTLRGPVVVANWITGTNLNAPSVESLAALLHRLHKVPLSDLPQSGFDYWHEFLKPRFSRAAEFLGETDLSEHIVRKVSAAWDSAPPCLMHPDLTPSNLVSIGCDQWRIIDNELLTIGGLPLLDVLNTARGLGPTVGQAHAERYLHISGMRPTAQNIDALQAAWLARAVGAAWAVGNLAKGQDLIHRYRRGYRLMPVTITS